jgi:hypothetical protein
VVAAQGPSGTYASGIACSNLSASSSANIVLTFYAQDSGAVALSYSDPTPIAAGASRNYFTPSSFPGLPASFLGAAVVSSDQPVACSVNTQVVTAGAGTPSTPARIGTSSGVDSSDASVKVYAPQVIKALGGFDSYIAVQNTESSAMTVNVNFVDRFGVAYPTARQSVSVPAQSTHVFYQSSNANLPAGFLGGATITSTGKLAATVNFYNAGTNSANAQFHSYNAFPAGGSKLFIPRFVRNYYGFNSGLSVQNVGGIATTVSITFTFNGVNYLLTSPSIAPGGTYSPYAPNITQLAAIDGLGVGQRFGSAVITAAAGGSVVAIANEDNRGTCNAAACPGIPANQVGFGSSYNAIVNGDQTATLFFPQITRNVSAALFSGGFQIANTTAGAGTCNITYSGAAGANEVGVALPGNGSISRFAPNVAGLPDGFNSSVKVTCTVAAVGIANLSARSVTYYGDSFTTGNGLNQ